MSFTDENLQQLKRELNVRIENITIWAPSLQALLSRLEAAEKCLVADPMPYHDRFQAWRKACGK